MATSRLLNNLYHNPYMLKLFKSFKCLETSTPIPNQALPIAFNQENQESKLLFTNRASKMIDYIRQLAYNQSTTRQEHGKADRDINFYCTGYVDHNGDYIIDDIIVPSIQYYTGTSKKEINYEKLYLSTHPRSVSQALIDGFNDYITEFNININKQGKKTFAMLGSTRATNKLDNERYAPTLSELSKAVAPGFIQYKCPIATGYLIIPPMNLIINDNKRILENGSLECTIIDYGYSPNKIAYPKSMHNVTKCQQRHFPDGITYTDNSISQSPQNLEGLPANLKYLDLESRIK